MIEKVLCPVCKKAAGWKGNPFRPFCSERCKMVDLGKWALEDYRIPGEKVEHEEEKKSEGKQNGKNGHDPESGGNAK